MGTPFKTGRKMKKDSSSDSVWTSVVERNLMSTGKPSRDRIFASKAGLCSRQTAGMMLLNDSYEETRKASTQFYFKIGNSFEDVMSRAFRKEKILVDRETRVELFNPLDGPEGLRGSILSGRIDFVLEHPIDGLPHLVELKTCGKLPTKPKPSHYAQLLTYLSITGMNTGLLWYVSRTVAGWDGQLKQRVFKVTLTEPMLRLTLKRITMGYVFGKAGYLPGIPSHMKKYKCGFCPLIPLCWDGRTADEVDITYDTPTPETRLELINQAEAIAAAIVKERSSLREEFLETLNIG